MTSAQAQTLPHVFAITDVAANDVLNVRRDPSVSAPILDILDSQRSGVEVLALSPDGAWGKIGIAEGNGWVAMHYMTALPQTADFPLPMTCFGTEPFWTLSITQSETRLDLLGLKSATMSLVRTTNLPNEYFAEFTQGQPRDRVANIRRQDCNDGMSDRDFGFRVSIFNSESVGGGAFQGCCTLQTAN